MLRLTAVLCIALVGCITKTECAEINTRFLDEIVNEGGFVEVCPPDSDMAIVHFGGPPGVATSCWAAEYEYSFPDCSASVTENGKEAEQAICRAAAAFPAQIELLGPGLRVDVSGSGDFWRIRFASAEQSDDARGILVILDGDRPKPVGILY